MPYMTRLAADLFYTVADSKWVPFQIRSGVNNLLMAPEPFVIPLTEFIWPHDLSRCNARPKSGQDAFVPKRHLKVCAFFPSVAWKV